MTRLLTPFVCPVIQTEYGDARHLLRDSDHRLLEQAFQAATLRVADVLSGCEPDGILAHQLAFLIGASDRISSLPYAEAIADYSASAQNRWTIYESLFVLSGECSRYLEIGTRRGWSLAVTLAGNPTIECVCVDSWSDPHYADAPNPGPAFVAAEVRKVAPLAKVRFLVADSHIVLPTMPQVFDLVLVDGDHSAQGAVQDVHDAWNLLVTGGIMVCDDLNYLLLNAVDLREILSGLGAQRVIWSHHGNGTAIALK